MSSYFIGVGNLGDVPKLKSIKVGDEKRDVVEFRIYIDRPVPDGDDGFKDKGGFWLNANLWGKRAAHVASLLEKGMRVRVVGTLVQDSWTDKETGTEKVAMRLELDDVSLSLGRVESLVMKPKETELG